MVRRSVWRCLRRCVTRCWPPAAALCLVMNVPPCLVSSAPACQRNSAPQCPVRSASRCLLSATAPHDKSAGRRRITNPTSLNFAWFLSCIFSSVGLLLRKCVSPCPMDVNLSQGNSAPVFLSKSAGQSSGRLPANSVWTIPRWSAGIVHMLILIIHAVKGSSQGFNGKPIETGYRQKRRQRSSLLLGGSIVYIFCHSCNFAPGQFED